MLHGCDDCRVTVILPLTRFCVPVIIQTENNYLKFKLILNKLPIIAVFYRFRGKHKEF